MLKNLLEDLEAEYEKQSSSASKVLPDDSRRTSFNTLAETAKNVFASVCPSFAPRNQVLGSWIADVPLIGQLFHQTPLTVDLTLGELAKNSPYGISIQSLLNLTQAGFVYLNFRDYDSLKNNDFKALKQSASTNGDPTIKNLQQIFNGCQNTLYFGSALRKGVFDLALASKQKEGKDNSKTEYEDFAKEAEEQLSRAETAFEKSGKNEFFRSERPSPVACRWHWAFLNSINLPKEVHERIHELYSRATSQGDENSLVESYLELTRELRSFHQIFTAPITASWGGVYNLKAQEYANSYIRSTTGEPARVYQVMVENWLPTIQEIVTEPYRKLIPSPRKKQQYTSTEVSNIISVLRQHSAEIEAANKSFTEIYQKDQSAFANPQDFDEVYKAYLNEKWKISKRIRSGLEKFGFAVTLYNFFDSIAAEQARHIIGGGLATKAASYTIAKGYKMYCLRDPKYKLAYNVWGIFND